MLKITLFIILAVVSWLEPGKSYANGHVQSPPECYSNDGKQVEFVRLPRQELWNVGAAVAVALNVDDRAIVGVDKIGFPMMPQAFQTFVLYHECAHHELGHTEKVHAHYDGDVTNWEPVADCTAAKKLVTAGFSREDFNQLFDAMSNRWLLYNLSWGVKQTGYNQKAYNRTPEQRVQAVKDCIQWTN